MGAVGRVPLLSIYARFCIYVYTIFLYIHRGVYTIVYTCTMKKRTAMYIRVEVDWLERVKKEAETQKTELSTFVRQAVDKAMGAPPAQPTPMATGQVVSLKTGEPEIASMPIPPWKQKLEAQLKAKQENP